MIDNICSLFFFCSYSLALNLLIVFVHILILLRLNEIFTRNENRLTFFILCFHCSFFLWCAFFFFLFVFDCIFSWNSVWTPQHSNFRTFVHFECCSYTELRFCSNDNETCLWCLRTQNIFSNLFHRYFHSTFVRQLSSVVERVHSTLNCEKKRRKFVSGEKARNNFHFVNHFLSFYFCCCSFYRFVLSRVYFCFPTDFPFSLLSFLSICLRRKSVVRWLDSSLALLLLFATFP